MSHRLIAAAAFLITALTAVGASAQTSPLDVRYDAEIPDLQAHLGHEFGAEITPPEDAVDYIYALAEAAPDQVRVYEYARSWLGRPLVYAIISSPENISNLETIQSNLARLADPRGLNAGQRDQLIAETPAVTWLSYGVHGDEISPVDGGLRTAYHLLTAENDPRVDEILSKTLVVIDPTQNPDGRDRFIRAHLDARGPVADSYRYSAEHDQPWPRGRSNYYLFDMNRDWFAMTQPETQGRVAAVQRWNPVVLVDSHEMGGDSTYFFPPSAEPFNPDITSVQREGQAIVGRKNAEWFDRLGYDYFTREVFDAFYPGYGDMWPTLNGAVAMTYEQASARGLTYRRDDGSILTYAQGVEQNFVASLATAEAVAENKDQFLRRFAEYRASAASNDGAYILDRASNRWGAERLARLLARQGIEVGRLEGSLQACGSSFSDGAFIIRRDQPTGRLIRTLLARQTDLPADFLAEQESRRERGLGHELYDVTAWSLPIMFDVDMTVCRSAGNLRGEPVEGDAPLTADIENPDAAYGYVIPWTDAGQAKLAASLALDGVAVRTSDEAFVINGRSFPRGSAIVPRAGQTADLQTVIADHARAVGAHVVGVDTSWTDRGPNAGSNNVHPLIAPRLAMAWDEGTSSLSAGATRFILEQRYGLPVTLIRMSTLRFADLSFFDALILPDGGGYSGTLGGGGLDTLGEFVREGGTLIAFADAAVYLSDPEDGLLPLRLENAAEDGEAALAESLRVEGRILDSDSAAETAQDGGPARPDSMPGALLSTRVNADHWLSAGYEDGPAPVVWGSDIFAPIPDNEAVTVFSFEGPDSLLASGHIWAENRAQIAYKPYIAARRLGAGHMIGFAYDPTIRAYQEGLDLLLLNAILLGPAHSRALR